MRTILIILLSVTILSSQQKGVTTGADLLFSRHAALIDGKRIGLVTNHTAVLADGRHLADALASRNGTTLAVLFGPEHGIRGDAPDGRTIRDTIDAVTSAPVYSLYGKINKPTPEMLKGVDVLVFDIQDVGARFYTFISTMFLAMEAAAEQKIPFIVLDRPNPITGTRVEGPLRVDSLKTFVGWVPVPIAHGMTVGELATMANKERWLKDGIQASLTVVSMEGWSRTQWYEQTGLGWIKPSPNMVSVGTAVVYPGMCLFEGVNVSEGRGTMAPFEQIGAPWIDGAVLAKELNSRKLPGVTFAPVQFTPEEIPGTASNPKYKGRSCGGVRLTVTDRASFASVRTGVTVVHAIRSLYRDSLTFRDRGFDRLAGTPVIREMLLKGASVAEIELQWEKELAAFRQRRAASLLYR
ncbi:MAG: DUF1343 domain-containing protein [Bacteroidetes bacterium]|nr:DUF1343 domain-containing protein [Bacteroidota bacterium]